LTHNSHNNKTLIEDFSARDLLPGMDHSYLTINYSDNFPGTDKKIKSYGEKAAKINSFFLEYVKGYHISAAFVKPVNSNSLLFINHQKFQFCIKILNVIDKRSAKIFHQKEGKNINLPLFEIHYGEGKDSLITESHLQVFDLCSADDIKIIYRICSKVNVVLKSYFNRRNFNLAELCCYFGKAEDKVYLVDGFTPDSLKILPLENNSKSLNPYKLITSTEIKHYTDLIFNLLNT
jgi:phosphoribosylaminoimidazole-succinocarboxamide synthase